MTTQNQKDKKGKTGIAKYLESDSEGDSDGSLNDDDDDLT